MLSLHTVSKLDQARLPDKLVKVDKIMNLQIIPDLNETLDGAKEKVGRNVTLVYFVKNLWTEFSFMVSNLVS